MVNEQCPLAVGVLPAGICNRLMNGIADKIQRAFFKGLIQRIADFKLVAGSLVIIYGINKI